jgi:hypothetical protein
VYKAELKEIASKAEFVSIIRENSVSLRVLCQSCHLNADFTVIAYFQIRKAKEGHFQYHEEMVLHALIATLPFVARSAYLVITLECILRH